MMTIKEQMQMRSEGPVNALVRGSLNAEVPSGAFEFAFNFIGVRVIAGGLMALPAPSHVGK